MKILAIDPATKCGWAFFNGNDITSGTWDFSNKRHEGGGMRFLRFRRQLETFTGTMKPEMVVYEEVRRHLGTTAAHVYGGLIAKLTSWCESHDEPIPYEGVPVGTIKKLATGKGNAKKDMMIMAAVQKWPCQDVKDDNQADALWIGQWAVENREIH